MKKIVWMIAVIIGISACKQNNAYQSYLKDPQLFCNTVYELNNVVMGNNFPPMIASRNYGYAAVAAYEAIAAGYPDKYQTLAGQLNGLQQSPQIADKENVSVELAALLAFIKVGEAVTFPEGSMGDYRDSILALAREKGLPSKVEKASKVFADSVAAIIIRWSKKDNYAQTRSAEKYTVMDVQGRWVPTPCTLR